MNINKEKHLLIVRSLLIEAIQELAIRADNHDIHKANVDNKIVDYIGQLETFKYGSGEYNKYLEYIKNNLDTCTQPIKQHHIEYFKNGINDMNIFDVLEYFIDTQANLIETNECTLEKSLEIHKKIYGFDDQLYNILKNTIPAIKQFVINANLLDEKSISTICSEGMDNYKSNKLHTLLIE